MSSEITVLLHGIPCSCREFNIGAVTVALVRADGHNILFNTGPYSERVLLTAKLKAQGLAPSDIDILVLSQIRWDTAINVDMFKGADIYVHEAELEYALNPDADDNTVPLFLGRFVKTMPKLNTIKGELELAPGIKLVELPGSSPGCVGLLADNSLLAGDAVPTVHAAYQKVLPNCRDAALAGESLKKALSIAETIYPGHDRPFAVREDGLEILGELDLRIRFFFSPTGQDQELVMKSEKQLTFITWPN
jgi:hypothetical protein